MIPDDTMKLMVDRDNRGLVMDLMEADTVVCTGVGKSGSVAALCASLLQSVGVHATFVHPVDMLHGSLAMLFSNKNSMIVAFTHSGFTREIVDLWERQPTCGCKFTVVTGHETLSGPDYVIRYTAEEEESQCGLIPIEVSVAQIRAFGTYVNALANICTTEYLASGHPAGALSQRYKEIIDARD